MKYTMLVLGATIFVGACNDETNSSIGMTNAVKEIHTRNFKQYCVDNGGTVNTVRDTVNQLQCEFPDGSVTIDK